MKLKELTLGQIIEIADKYKGNCSKCPLCKIVMIPCFEYCDTNKHRQNKIKESLEQEIDYEQH